MNILINYEIMYFLLNLLVKKCCLKQLLFDFRFDKRIFLLSSLSYTILQLFIIYLIIRLYLCWQVEDTKWILCCRKTDVKCAY